MSEGEVNKAEKAAVPEVPGVLRLGWMLFMQPMRLQRTLSTAGETPFTSIHLWRKEKEGSSWASSVLRLFGLCMFTWIPAVVVLSSVVLCLLGGKVSWSISVAAIFIGITIASVVSLRSIVQALRLGLTVSLVFAIGAVDLDGVGIGGFVLFVFGGSVVLRELMSTRLSYTMVSAVRERAIDTIIMVLIVVAAPLVRGGVAGRSLWAVLREDAWLFAGEGLVFSMVFFQIHTYLCECMWMQCVSVVARLEVVAAPRLVCILPFRVHDMIFFPLPGLRSYVMALARLDPALAISIIAEAVDTIGQKAPVLRALDDLRACSLERAARDRTWSRAAAFDLHFLPRPGDASESASPLHGFRAVAQELAAAYLTTDHIRRNNLLTRAHRTLESFRVDLASKRRPDYMERRLLPVTRLWLDVIDDELQALATLEREHPQIPTPFEPGPPLRPEDAALFKGRVDLIRLIDHDLADHRRAPILLTGQRRMGKTSLQHMLPVRLGTGTLVLPLNFQSLSGNPHKAHPHRWLAESLAKARPDLPSPPATTDWADTLAWLQSIEPALGNDRVLVAIDEIERLQTGIEEGWATPAFLDFLRAAGDSLRKIRLLLVSAHPLHRLGRAWTDRLISVVHRDIGYLEPHEAEELITHPMDGFPDIYPPGGVARIAGETRGHPYLVQLVCDALVRDLNGRGKLSAEDADVTRALDRALGDTPLFRELWSDRQDGERAILRDLAGRTAGPLGEREAEARDLLHEGLIERDGEQYRVAVPLFAAWIRERA